MLTGCDFEDLECSKAELLAHFSGAFGSMNIAGEFDLDPVEIKGVSFDDSEYLSNLPYSISFIYYPSGSFQSGYYGVIEPSDSVSYDEAEDGTVEMRRQISVKGLLTDSSDKDSALNNAKAFIDIRRDIVPEPFLIRNTVSPNAVMQYYLVSSEESFNRITNTANLSQVFKTDANSLNGDLVHRYTIDEKTELGQPTTVSYQGQIDVGKYGNFSRARQAYKDFKASLNILFLLDENIREDTYINRLTYSLSMYKNANVNNFPEIQDDFSITISEDASSSLVKVDVRGQIGANYGCLEDRTAKVKSFFSIVKNGGYHYDLAKILYDNFYEQQGSNWPIDHPVNISLRKEPLSEAGDFDEYQNTLSYNVSLNDRYVPQTLANCNVAEMNLGFEYGIDLKAISEQYLGGYYICQDLGVVSREKLNIQITRSRVSDYKGNALIKTYSLGTFQVFKDDTASVEFDEKNSYSRNEERENESFSLSRSYNITNGFGL